MPADTRAVIWRIGTKHSAVLRQVAAERSLTVVREIAVGRSGTDGQARHEMTDLVAAARGRQFGVLVVWSLVDVEPRGVRELISLLLELTRRGVRVASVTESWAEEAPYCENTMEALVLLLALEEEQRRSRRWHAVDRKLLSYEERGAAVTTT